MECCSVHKSSENTENDYSNISSQHCSIAGLLSGLAASPPNLCFVDQMLHRLHLAPWIFLPSHPQSWSDFTFQIPGAGIEDSWRRSTEVEPILAFARSSTSLFCSWTCWLHPGSCLMTESFSRSPRWTRPQFCRRKKGNRWEMLHTSKKCASIKHSKMQI